MLTRLKVSGFKNLVDVDVRFGPFTCIAGANGVGKSNLFDAIRFLALLADHTIMESALSVRDDQPEGRRRTQNAWGELDGLFHRSGDERDAAMRFDAEMIVPGTAVDDLGQEGKAKTTFLRYTLELRRPSNPMAGEPDAESVQVYTEELTYLAIGDLAKHVLFDTSRDWRVSAVHGACRSPLISTVEKDGKRVIRLHQDGTAGRTSENAADKLPRTILSRASASESKTALCARREMASWVLLQLEPTSLRRPSGYRDPVHLGTDGSNLASTLNHLARHNALGLSAESVYCRVANRLSELIGDVNTVHVDDDPKREVLTLVLTDFRGTPYPARALSDGTLRFLALTVLEMDARHSGVLCLEEPENGIHPERLAAMLTLLQQIATDTTSAIGDDNPLRQVMVNTHSPSVVALVPGDALLLARPDGHGGVTFASLTATWRDRQVPATQVVGMGELLAYLNPRGVARAAAEDGEEDAVAASTSKRPCSRRVMDRQDVGPFLPGASVWVADH